jgi:hypothetical protein
MPHFCGIFGTLLEGVFALKADIVGDSIVGMGVAVSYPMPAFGRDIRGGRKEK